MKPRITILTLGVNDLDAALAFYRDGLGLATEGIVGQEFAYGAVAFFPLQPGQRTQGHGGCDEDISCATLSMGLSMSANDMGETMFPARSLLAEVRLCPI